MTPAVPLEMRPWWARFFECGPGLAALACWTVLKPSGPTSTRMAAPIGSTMRVVSVKKHRIRHRVPARVLPRNRAARHMIKSFRCPTRRPISAQEMPCACRRPIRRCRNPCGLNTGTAATLQARAIAVRRRSPVAPAKSRASGSRSSRGGTNRQRFCSDRLPDGESALSLRLALCRRCFSALPGHPRRRARRTRGCA